MTRLSKGRGDKNKPYTFCARVGGKPFKVQIKPKYGTVVTGLWNDDYYYRFTRPVQVKEGDIFSALPGKGLILNGKILLRKIIRPKRKTAIKIGWAPEKLRIAVFAERDEIWSRRAKKPTGRYGKPYWCAVDTRGYWLGIGDTVQVALSRLIEQLKFTELMAKEDQKKGHRIIRWHVERTPGTRKELLGMEKKARKTGFILDGVEWRKAEFAKALTK